MKREREEQSPNIPDLEIIDLEEEENRDGENAENQEALAEDDASSQAPAKKRHYPRINMHIVLLVVAVIFVCGIAYKIMNFGQYVDLDEIFKDGQGTYDDTLDEILPLMDADGNRIPVDYSDGLTIVTFGNAPFADDRGADDNLAHMIAEMADATVYNCSVSGSYLAAEFPYLSVEDKPWDVFNFYWLCTLATGGDVRGHYMEALNILGDKAPAESQEVYDTLTTLDFNEVDVIAILYDASDYLAGHDMYSDQNSTDIQQFTGNLEAGIELLQSVYPHIRIIVMSPPYAYGIDDNGEYISSDIQRYGHDVLSTYVIKQYASCVVRSVSFVDNLYGTITEDNADKYLTDNLHLNTAGRKALAERFMYALNYYNNSQSQE